MIIASFPEKVFVIYFDSFYTTLLGLTMIIASFPEKVFVIYFDSFYTTLLGLTMIIASFPEKVFVIYFDSFYTKALEVMCDLLHHFAGKLKDFDLKKHDRFFELFEKKPVE